MRSRPQQIERDPSMFVDMFKSPHLLALIHICHDMPGTLDDVALSRVLGCVPSEAQDVLEDLFDWGMIQPVGCDSWAATYRGIQNCLIYVPQTPRAQA
tara:strand:- start:414 stop:707 length:294 start_codon:yes stop_codon:yes gene_type:complete